MHHWGYVMEQLTHGAAHAVGGQDQVNSIEIRRNRRRWVSLVGRTSGQVPPGGAPD